MTRAHVAVALLLVVALGVSNLVYVLHETNKHHVSLDHHPLFRPLFVRSTRLLPAPGGVCGVGWEYAPAEDRCVRSLHKTNDARFLRAAVDTCEDFYGSSCGAFNADPANAGEASLFAYVQRLSGENVEELVRARPQNATADELRVEQFYQSCVARKRDRKVELAASKTLRALLSATGSLKVTSHSDIAALWGYLQRYDTILPLELTLELDPWQATRLVPSLRWSGVAVAESLSAVTERLSLIYSPSTARMWAESVMRIENDLIELAQEEETPTNFFAYLRQGRGVDFISSWLPVLSNFRFNVSRFVAACAPEDTSTQDWLEALGKRPLWTPNFEYLTRLPDVVERYTPETWLVYTKHAILYHLDNEWAPKLAYHRLYDAQHALPWTRPRFPISTANVSCVQMTHAFIPHTVDRLYAARFFSEPTRERATLVARSVHAHFVDRLAREGLVSLATKVSALRLDVGMPTEVPPSTLVLRDGASYVDNVLQVRRYHIENNYRQLFRETLPLWVFSDGLATNTAAYYQHQLNGLTVSVGMLQPPIFSPDFSDASVYARLGAFVAHEIAHSIDRTGRLFGADGSYVGGDSEYTAYEQCLVACYSGTTPLGNTHNGVQTLNENFADALGVQIAYEAFLEGGERSEEDRQAFFRAYAQLFCRAPQTTAQEQASIATSRHALPLFRVNNVLNGVYGFYDAWHCKNTAENSCSFFMRE